MTFQANRDERQGAGARRLAILGGGIALGYAVALALMALRGAWIVDPTGAPILTDFTAIWSAGRLALHGAALSAYDGAAEHAAEVAVIGHGFDGFYGWPYPPQFLFVARALASVPYVVAFPVWVAASALLHAAAVGAVARRWAAGAIALASPWALASLVVGQNGLLTGALIALALLCLERRPALAGLMLGLLAYKPQFGLLFPIALIAAGRWRAFGWAAAAVVGLIAAACAVFGPDSLSAFVTNLPETTRALVSTGGVGFFKLQSAYGLARQLGAPQAAGWTIQATISLAAALVVVVLWRSRADYALKAAGLAVAALLATPYVFAYDLAALAVPLAFLWRQRPFDRVEYAALALAVVSVAPFMLIHIPSGVFASLAVGAAVARRAVQEAQAARPAPGLAGQAPALAG
jgi:arabinofuranan 3-O-arabinosyltransferase